MENKWKKIGTITLTIYLTLVTIGCALFGFLYFSSKAKNGETFDAKSLINTICYDMGAISQQEYVKRGGKVETPAATLSAETYATAFNASDYEFNYTKDEIDYGEIGETAMLKQSLAMFLVVARELVYGNQYKQNQDYHTEFTAHVQFGDFVNEMSLSYKIDSSTIILNLAVCGKYVEETEWSGISNVLLLLTEESDGSWTLENFAYKTPEGSKMVNSSTADENWNDLRYSYTAYKGKNHSIYYYSTYSVYLRQNLAADQQITSASQVMNIDLREINVNTHKKLLASNQRIYVDKTAYLPEGTYIVTDEYKIMEPNMSNEDIVNRANIVRNTYLQKINGNEKAFTTIPPETNIGQLAAEAWSQNG